jgi:uncharacterized protein (TIGR00106 family)
MIAEFSIVPIGSGESLSDYVAEAYRLVEQSGLKHQLTATGTIIEGDYDEVMDVISQCHKKVRTMAHRVLTRIWIDDRGGASDEMEKKVQSVMEKI